MANNNNKAAMALGRQTGKTLGLNDLFKAMYGSWYDETTTVDEWMKLENISQKNLDTFPNARLAQELKSSPLAQSMKEEEGTEEYEVRVGGYGDVVYTNPKTFNGLLDLLSKDKDFYGAPVHIDLNPPKKKKNAKSKS